MHSLCVEPLEITRYLRSDVSRSREASDCDHHNETRFGQTRRAAQAAKVEFFAASAG